MKFTLLVTEAPFGGQAATTALAFAAAAIARGHEIERVFFYCDGVHNANRLAAPPGGEANLVRDWSKFAADNAVDLVVCINAGGRRGLREANLAPGFRISGLGQLVEAMVQADRFVPFGA